MCVVDICFLLLEFEMRFHNYTEQVIKKILYHRTESTVPAFFPFYYQYLRESALLPLSRVTAFP